MIIPKNNPIVRSTLAVVVITLLAKSVGYLEKVILAYYFGTGPEVDVFLVVFGIIFSLFILIRELIEPGFLNIFMKAHSKASPKEAWRLFNSIGFLVLLFSLIITVFGVYFAEEVVGVFAPGFNHDKKILATRLTRVAFPALTFLSLSALTYITLNGLKIFALPAIGDIVFKGLIIVTFILLYNNFGILGAAIGVVFGAVGRLAVHLTSLRKYILMRLPQWDADQLDKMWSLTWPIFVGVLFSQISSLVDNIFASYLGDGTIAALGYAKKIMEMPIIVFPYALSIIVFPYFSQLAIEKEKQKLANLLSDSLRWIVLLFLPLSIFLFASATPVVEVLLERGSFDQASTLLTSQPLTVYTMGMLAMSVETVLVLFYFANADTKTPIFVGIICVILNIILTYIFIQELDYLGIPLALVISKTVKVLVLLFLLYYKIDINVLEVGRFISKVVVATIGFGVSIYLFETYTSIEQFGSFVMKLGYLGLNMGLASCVYILVLRLLRIPLFNRR